MLEKIGGLKEICGDSVALFDTCSLINLSSCSNGNNGHGKKSEKREFLNGLVDFVRRGGGIFITPEVLGEYRPRKKLKWVRSQRALFRAFQDGGRVFDFSRLSRGEQKIYQETGARYYNFVRIYDLSQTDFGLLLASVILSEKFLGGAGLITNDKGLQKSVLDFLKISSDYHGKLWVAEREGFNSFRKYSY